MSTLTTTLLGRATLVSGALEHIIDITALSTYERAAGHQFIGYRWSETYNEPFIVFGSADPTDSGQADGLGYPLSRLVEDPKVLRHAAIVAGIEEALLLAFIQDNLPYAD